MILPNEIEHQCWHGPAYAHGFRGARIAVCGYSHYSDHHDHVGLTNDIVGDVVSGAARYAFFTAIARTFGEDDLAAFWNTVLFFNFVPASVGAGEDKFAVASSAENERARARVLRIMEECRPDKLFVFSTKAWAAFPRTDEERSGSIHSGEDVQSGTYTIVNNHRVRAFGLRHPQGASAAELRAAVLLALDEAA